MPVSYTHLKERSEISGSTRKIGRQKGGGGARRGDMNSPVLVGGCLLYTSSLPTVPVRVLPIPL